MSSAEHLIENLIYGMKRGLECEDILNEPCNVMNLADCDMSAEEAVAIACHVVWGLYEKFPECGICEGKCEKCVRKDSDICD